MIKWNEVTWYSRLGALILFLLVIPALSFYIGVQFESAIEAASIPKFSVEEILIASKDKQAVSNPFSSSTQTLKISFPELKVGTYSLEAPKLEILYQSNQLVRNTINFENNGISYQILSSDISPTGRQAPALFAHKIQYLNPATNNWTDLEGQSELGPGFSENTGFTIVAYEGSLYIISNARQGFHYNELLGISGMEVASYRKITGQNIMGIISSDQNVYLQVDDSSCSDPGAGSASCPKYYEFDNNGALVSVNVQLPDPFLQQQG